MGGVPNAPGPSPTLGSLGPSHQWHHKSRASLRGPPCAHGVAGTPQGEVRDKWRGYHEKEATWVAAKDMVHAKEIVERFEKTRARGSNKRKHRH